METAEQWSDGGFSLGGCVIHFGSQEKAAISWPARMFDFDSHVQ
jgi:hypothetical protein